MAVPDADFGTDLTPSEGGDTLWSLPIAAPASEPLDWASLLEDEISGLKQDIDRERSRIARMYRKGERVAESLRKQFDRRLAAAQCLVEACGDLREDRRQPTVAEAIAVHRAILTRRLAFVLCLLALGQTVMAQTQPQAEHALPLVRSASHPVQEGFVRIINRSNRRGTVSIHAIDDSGRRVGPLSLSLNAKETVHFNSEDLERGNPSKGLPPPGAGTGHGDWRLELDTELDIEALGYIRTSGGFVTSMHDVVEEGGAVCSPAGMHVVTFNPASNQSQRSWLRLINPTDADVNVTIRGQDDAGDEPEGEVRLRIPAGAAETVTAQALESGGAGLAGQFGDGHGKWQLFITADGAIQVMNLLQSANGNLTNLSTTPRMAEAPGALRTSYELQSSVLRTRWRDFVSLGDEYFDGPVAYGDFDCDGDEDFFMAPSHITATIHNDGRPAESAPVQLYENDGDGDFALSTESFIRGEIPESVAGRKVLTGDFNGDGKPDIFVADHGADSHPFPGAHPVLLLSSVNGLRRVAGLEHVVGFHHGAASGDIDQDGDLDIFLTDTRQPLFLENDGGGKFVRDLNAVPAELKERGAFTTEIIDVDDDGAPDLLVAGHEYEDQPTVIYWGDRSGTYDASRKTTLPAVPGRGVVVDIDAEDLDGDGDRDIVLSRTSSEPFYAGYYVQVVAGHGSRRFADETARRITDGDRPTARWLEWIRIEDVNRDGFPDLWVDDITHWGVTWINDGSGRFTRLNPVGLAPIDYAEFDARFVGKQLNSVSFSISFLPHDRFVDAEDGNSHAGTYHYGYRGQDSGTLHLDYEDVDLHCTVPLEFVTTTTGSLTYSCSDGTTGSESWQLEDTPGT